jgi:outer membrane protein TolC
MSNSSAMPPPGHDPLRRGCPRLRGAWVLLPSLLLSGCLWQSYRPEPLQPGVTAARLVTRNLADPDLRTFLHAHGVDTATWPLRQWNLRALSAAALYFNPRVAEAMAEVDAARAGEITAAARPNPGVDLRSEHHSDTAGGRTPWSLGAALSWIFEPPQKRAARQAYARARTQAARAAVTEKAWSVMSTVRDRCLNYADALARLETLRRQMALVKEAASLLARRAELGQTSDFEVSSMRLEVDRVELALHAAEAGIETARTAIASAMGLPASALARVDLNLGRRPALPAAAQVSTADLQRAALTRRADILRSLEQYAVSEAALKRQIARQYPDITLSPGYLFDQADNVWSLGAAALLPLLDRNQGPIAEAKAQRDVAARRFESLQSQVLSDLQDARAAYLAALKSIQSAQRLQARLEKREGVIRKQVEAGETGRLALVRAELETQAARVAAQGIRAQAWRALARLEDASQTSLTGATLPLFDLEPNS